MPDLRFPDHLPTDQRDLVRDLATRNVEAHGDGFLGLALTGSAGRGLATAHSDLDVLVILTDEAASSRRTVHTPEVDEIPCAMQELLDLPPFGSEEWWGRWACAWVPVLLDRTPEQTLPELLTRQATLDPDEADAVLIDHDRLDGWVNFAYRALKSDRDGRRRETRLDANESVPWLLDVVFAFAGRVRPYNKYLAWELRTHPIPGWPAEELLDLIERTMAGEADAIRQSFGRVHAASAAHDRARGHTRTADLIDGWGDELALFSGASGPASGRAPEPAPGARRDPR